MRIADIEFINYSNAEKTGIGSKLVSNNTLVFFNLHGIKDEELEDIVNYKSFVHKTWKQGKVTEYFVYKYGFGQNSKVVYCHAGFSPILIRYLQNHYGYLINGKELYRAREIAPLPTMKYQLWDFQRDANQAWVNAGCFGILQCPTASGKSIIGCAIIKKMNTRTIILCHTSDLLINVWFNYLVEQFGGEIKSRIGIIGGNLSNKDRKLMRITSEGFDENIKKDIVIATSQSLLRGDKLSKLGEEHFGLMIIDEIHHYAAEQFKKVSSVIRAVYRLGLSATIHRPDGLSPIFHALLGDVRYRVGIKELVRKGLLVEPIFYSIIINDELACNKIRNCRYKLLEYSRYVKKVSGSSELKFRYILGLCESLKSKGRKFMLYTDFVNKQTNVDEDGTFTINDENVFTRDEYVKKLKELKIKVVGVSSEMSGLERQFIFNKLGTGEIDGIVFGSLGNEGINIPAINAIIMANATASTIRFPQRVGRGMRIYKGKKNCYVYEVILNTTKELQWSTDNFLEYEEQGFTKERVFVNNDGYLIKKEIKEIKS
jgi:superfamily II DNA or RNA helicase